MLDTKILNSIHVLLKKNLRAKLVGIIILSTGIQFAFAHGTVTSPPSRVWNCYQENPENPSSAACISAVVSHGTQPLYDWNEINQGEANGEHMLFVPDGNLASGGRPEKYGGMDQVRSDWVATAVSSGPFTVTWTNSAPHATEYYQVYITKEDWTPDQPLTWESLTLLTQTSSSPAASSVDIPVDLPSRTGKHVIYSIWQRSDSPEAFYSTSDVDFGNETTSTNDAIFLEKNIVLFPNPVSDKMSLDFTLPSSIDCKIQIHDAIGNLLLEKNLKNISFKKLDFEVSNFENGLYFIKVQTKGKIWLRKFIIQKN